MTSGFLREIVGEVRAAVGQPLYGVEGPDSPHERPPSLREAIERDRDRGALVLEYKRASPGQRDPRLPARSIEEFLRLTEGCAPTAYSCLATEPSFGGAPRDVQELVGLTRRPVLFKEFVIDRRQIDVAARTGASAVLLIARLASEGLLDEPIDVLAEAAHRRGLEVLLEFHSRTELSLGANVAADVYGVNARDLDTLTIDRATADATIGEARQRGFRPLLGLSGVDGPAEAQRFWRAGVDGILVGSAVARARAPGSFVADLLRVGPRGDP